MRITIRDAQAVAHEIQIGDIVTLQELRLDAAAIELTAEPGGAVRAADANATLVVTEANLNRLLARQAPAGVRDLEIATLSGRVRITGRWIAKGIPVPFTLMAVPEIEGGARLRLHVQQVHVLGPVALPGVVAQGIGNMLNDNLARAFDATRLPIPLRLTGLQVEPGRVLVSATAPVEVRLGQREPPLQPESTGMPRVED